MNFSPPLFIIVLLFILGSTGESTAQFPEFVEYGGEMLYLDDREATQRYRDLGDVDNVIDINFASDIANSIGTKINNKLAAITTAKSNKALSDRQKNKQIADLRNEIKLLQEAQVYFTGINTFMGDPKAKNYFVPAFNNSNARDFFYRYTTLSGNTDFISDVALQSNLDETALSSNVLRGNLLKVFFADISTTFIENPDTLEQNILGSKVLYGGIANGSLTFPLFYMANKSIVVYLPIGIKSTLDEVDVSEQDNDDDFVNFNEAFLSGYFRFPITNSDAGEGSALFFNGRLSRYSGNSNFYKKLENLEDPFVLFRAVAGVEIGHGIRIAASFNIGKSGAFKDLQTTTVGIQVDPAALSRQ